MLQDLQDMKKIFKYIIAPTILLFSGLSIQADEYPNGYKIEDGKIIATSKKVKDNGDGSYTITMEAFATGSSTYTSKSTPVDIVLVLDVSNSMNQSYNGTTRIRALKAAVQDFIGQIAHNDLYEDETDTKRRDDPLGNRIAIVTFGGQVNIISNGLNGSQNGGFVPVASTDNVTNLKNAVNNAGQNSGTRTDLGMDSGSTLINNSVLSKPNSKRVLIVFSDGDPANGGNNTPLTPVTNQSPTAANIAKDAITLAKTVKDTGSTVYSIGLITDDKTISGTGITVTKFLKILSNHYPSATSYSDSDLGDYNDDGTFYYDAATMDLSAAFKAIGQASGGTTETIPSSTEVRDIVTNSFSLPNNVNASDIKVYTCDMVKDMSGSWTTDSDGKEVWNIATGVTPSVNKETKTITVKGFDYTLNDSPASLAANNADGNWVGLRYKQENGSATTEQYYAGKKLIIEFLIYPEEEATGGSTETNTSDSGIYVYNSETETYDKYTAFEIPNTILSINIEIQKSGLRSGESATFEIWRANPMRDTDGNIVYNALGKPKPEEDSQGNILWGAPDYRSGKYNAWSKVVITNKTGTNGATVTETLKALDPNYVYKVTEDDWGWAYSVQAKQEGDYSTSSTVINPFIFTNTEKTTINGQPIKKHAEAVTINHFATSKTADNAYEEHYKSSKVKSF